MSAHDPSGRMHPHQKEGEKHSHHKGRKYALAAGFFGGVVLVLLMGMLTLGLILKWSSALQTSPTSLLTSTGTAAPGEQGSHYTSPTNTVSPPDLADSSRPSVEEESKAEWLPAGARWRLGGGDVSQIAFSPDGQYLVAVGPLGLYFYRVDTPGQFEFWGAPDYQSEDWSPSMMALSIDGRTLVGVWNNYFVVWRLDTQRSDWPAQARYDTLWAGSPGVTGEVTGIALSPDGELLAVRTDEGEIDIVDIDKGHIVDSLWDYEVMPCYSCNVQCDSYDVTYGAFAFAQQGDLIVDSRSCSRSGKSETYVWNVEWGALDFKVQGGSEVALFSPDGRLLLTMEYDGINLWDTSTGEFVDSLVYAFDTLYYSPTSAAFSPDGDTLYVGYYDGTLAVWSVPTRSLLKTVTVPSGIFDIDLSPDGQQIIYLTGAGNIILNDTALEEEGSLVATHTNRFWGLDFSHVAFSSDGSRVLWAETSGVRAWDVFTGDLIYRINSMDGSWFDAISVSQDHIATHTASGQGQLWLTSNGEKQASLEAPTTSFIETETGDTVPFLDIYVLLFSPDGNLLAGASSDGVYIWDAATGSLLKTIPTTPGESFSMPFPSYSTVFGLAFSPDSSLLAVLVDNSGEYEADIWELPHGQQPLQVLSLGGKDLSGWATFVNQGRQLVVQHYGDEPSFSVWDVQTGALVSELPGGYEDAAISNSGNLLAIFDNNLITIWNTETWETTQTLKTGPAGDFRASVRTVAFSSDDRWIAGGTYGGHILVWDTETGERIAWLKGHQYEVISLQFSPDNLLLASASDDGSLLIWEMSAVKP